MAVNPCESSTEEWNNFEAFRQGLTEYETFGEWPADKAIFDRSEISFEFGEYDSFTTQFNLEKMDIEENIKKRC